MDEGKRRLWEEDGKEEDLAEAKRSHKIVE